MSADDTRALRLLAAADRVREAGEAHRAARTATDAAYETWRQTGRLADCAAWRDLAAIEMPFRLDLAAAIAEHTAIALEPGDCAWERAVLEAAGTYERARAAEDECIEKRCAAASAWSRTAPPHALEWDATVPEAKAWGDAAERAGLARQESDAAEHTLLAAARGAR